MTIRSLRPRFALLLICLSCLAGCNTRTPDELDTATEKVLQEVGVGPDPKPAETPPVSDLNESIPPSVVKQEPTTSKSDAAVIAPQPGTRIAPKLASNNPKLKPTFTIDALNLKWTSPNQLPKETWELQYLGNTPVGFTHRKVEVSQSLGPGYLRLDSESRLRVSVNGKPVEQRVQIFTIERDNGELLNIEGSLERGDHKQSFTGRVGQGLMKLNGIENEQPFAIHIEWRDDYRGPFAVEQSMRRRPLQPRETRTLKYFDPILRKVIDGRLEAGEYIMTPTMLGDSKEFWKELLEVLNIATLGEDGSQSLSWVDRKGESLKSYFHAKDVLSFRTAPIAAQIVESALDLRAIDSGSIPVKGTLERLIDMPDDLASMVYRVTHKSAEPFRMFTDRVSQHIRALQDPRAVEITVFRSGISSDLNLGKDLSVIDDAGALTSSDFIPSSSPQIQKLAKAIITNDKTSTSNTEKANQCRLAIYKRVKLKEFDKQIGIIANTLSIGEADCIEHATLFASVCRALNIPARIALGVKFNRSQEIPAMKFHTWIEIQDDKRWVSMDSTEEAFPTSIDRIKIRDSNFNGANPYIDVLSVYRLLPEFEIQVMPK